jgi:hypothetical protein
VREVRWALWRGAQLLEIHVAEMIDVEAEESWEFELA